MELTTNERYILYKFIKKLAIIHKMSISELSVKCRPALNSARGYLHNSLISGTLDTITNALMSVSRVLNTLAPMYFLHDVLNDDYTERWNNLQLEYNLMINKRNQKKYNYLGIIRRSKGISTKDFAHQLGVEYGDINIIETCKRPNILTIIKAAPILGISTYALGKKFNYGYEQIKNTIKVTSPNSICHYLYKLRKQHGYKQKQLANLLGIKQSNVSTMEALRPPTLSILMKLSKLYKMPVLTLLHKHPKYKDIEKDSPAYKVIKLCMNKHMTPNELSNKVGDINNSINYVISKLQYETDHIDINIANKLINVFNLPPNYFGKIVDKQFIASFNHFKYDNPNLTELDFGYRLAKMCDKYHFTLNKIGTILNVSRERVCQLEHTKLLNIKYKTLKDILKIFPKNETMYLKGNYHCLNDVFDDYDKKDITNGVKELVDDPNFKVGDLFKYFYQELHLNNKNIAALLNSGYNKFFYNKITSQDIGYAKSTTHPTFPLAMKLSDFFNIPLIVMLNEYLKYRHMELHSPAYKIFKIRMAYGITTVDKLSKYVKIPPHDLKYVQLHAQYNGSPISEKISDKFIKAFHLPKDYFIMYKYKKLLKNRNHLHSNVYGKLIHFAIDIYLVIIKLLIMSNRNPMAITYVNKLNILLNNSNNISLTYVLQSYLKLLEVIQLDLKDYKKSSKTSNILKILSIRIRYALLKETTSQLSLKYEKKPNISKQIIGKLNQEYASLFIKWINFYRAMFNLPMIKLSQKYCKEVQCGVDELSLVNKGAYHGFSNLHKPDTLSKEIWSIGSRVTLSSIISNISTNPTTLIFKYLNNDLDNKHSREWILDKGLRQVGVGQNNKYNGLLVMNSSDLNNKDGYSNSIIAFPNHGVFPFENVKNGKWGLYLPNPPYGKDLYSDIRRDGISIHVHDNTDNKFMPVSNIKITSLLDYGYYIGISYSVYNTKVNHNYSITITGIPNINKYSYKVTLFTLKI